MPKTPKPLPCDERWANMTTVNGGRVCQSCTKLIVDFRKKSWNEISETQQENGNTVCGIYSTKQLAHWGKEPPSKLRTIKKAASLVAISSAVSATVLAQETDKTDYITIYGTVTGDFYSKEKDKMLPRPVENASVQIEPLNIESKTDSLGNFAFKVAKAQLNKTVFEMTTVALWYGKQKIKVDLEKAKNDSVQVAHYLNSPSIKAVNSPTPVMFYAAPPTLREQVQEKIDTLKGKK